MTPYITVVMPVRNEAHFIRDTMLQLLRQDYPSDRLEIIVADGMSDDGTQDIVLDLADAYPQVRLLKNPKRLSSSGRNIGFKNGKGDYFLVVDGHCHIPNDQMLRNIADCFEKSGADCLGRPQPLDPPGLTSFQQAVALARGSRLGHGGDSMIYGQFEGYASPVSNGAAYKRDVFDRIGYVDEAFDACEDVEFNYRVEKAGLKSYTSPKLMVRYFPREDLKGVFRQMVRYGHGRYRFVRKHPEALTVNQLVPAGFVVGLMIAAVAGIGTLLVSPLSLVALAITAVYACYLVIVLAESFRLARKIAWSCLPMLPLIFFSVHCGLGYGLVVEFLKNFRFWRIENHNCSETESQSYRDSVIL